MKKLIQIAYNRFPEDWLKSHGIVKILAVFVTDTEGSVFDEGEEGYEINGLFLRVACSDPHCNKDAITRGINKIGYPSDLWAAGQIKDLPVFDSILDTSLQTTQGVFNLTDDQFEDMLDRDLDIEFSCPPA